MKNLSILILEPASDLGGVSHYILKITRHIDPSFRIFFAAPPGGEILEDEAFRKAVTFLPFDFHHGLFSFFASARRFRKMVAEHQIVVVHAHTLRTGFFAALALWFSRVALVYTPHGLRFLQKKSMLGRQIFLMMDRLIGARAQALTALSPKEKGEMVQFGLKREENIFITPSCVDEPEKELYAAALIGNVALEGRFIVGMVGRMTEQKDPFGFLAIAKKVKEKIPGALFVWVGDGELRKDFLEQAEKLGLSSSLVLAGHASHDMVLSWISRFNVLLFTSLYEGLPIVLIEACSIGVPIVASNVGSVSDIIKEGETGALFRSDDRDTAVNAVVAVRAMSSAEREAMRARQRELVRRSYAPESRLAKEYEKIYRSLTIN